MLPDNVSSTISPLIGEDELRNIWKKKMIKENQMLPDEMEAEKNRKMILAQADEIEILKQNVRDLQESLQHAHIRIKRLTEGTNAHQ